MSKPHHFDSLLLCVDMYVLLLLSPKKKFSGELNPHKFCVSDLPTTLTSNDVITCM